MLPEPAIHITKTPAAEYRFQDGIARYNHPMSQYKRSFALEPDGLPRLHLTWQGNAFFPHCPIQVYLDDHLLGEVPNRDVLRQGQTFHLPDGQPLTVCQEAHRLNAYLGETSLSDQEHPGKLRAETARLYLWISVLDVVLPLLAWAAKGQLPAPPTVLVIGSGIAALAYFGLYYLARQNKALAFLLGGLLSIPNAAVLTLLTGSLGLGWLLIAIIVGLRSFDSYRSARKLTRPDLQG